MSQNEHLPDGIYNYLVAHNPPVDQVTAALIDETASLGSARSMQLGVDQAAFLGFMVGLLRPTFVIEIGTFTGLSALEMARALPDDGHLLCCEVSEEYTDIAKRYWAEAGVTGRITLQLAPAIETLADLPDTKPVDLAFIDADKEGYIDYFEALVPRLAPQGLIVADNIFMGGRVIDPAPGSSGEWMVKFADHVQADTRTETVVVPIGDGFTLTRLVDQRA